jgi:hypothetical protein
MALVVVDEEQEEEEEGVEDGARAGVVRHQRTALENDLTAYETDQLKTAVKRTLSVFQRTVEFLGMPEEGWKVDLNDEEKCKVGEVCPCDSFLFVEWYLDPRC